MILILVAFFTPYFSNAAVDTAQLCASSVAGNNRIAAVVKSLGQDEFFNFVNARSIVLSCKSSGEELKLGFTNGDKVIYNTTQVAPRADVELTKPIDEKIAFLIALKAMAKSARCDLNIRTPTEVKKLSGGLKTKTYWCGETSALSLTSNSAGKTTKFSTWLIH